ncbi:MAG: 16S rRNA (adenine(1518)-N(6)/adenine(1519)-N(6))-dimethyltransferase RsmA [Patescibacteria group bacterium]
MDALTNLNSRITVQNLLKKHAARAQKKFGQNFLVDKGVIKRFIEAAAVKKEDIILEIGPGIGTLTRELAEKARKVIAIEKDPKMLEILEETLAGLKNIEIVQGDARISKSENFNLKSNGYKVAANLPFYLTAPIIRSFLEAKNPPKEMVFIVQKEVAQRICAKPPRMNLLAVSVQFYAAPKIVVYISKRSFWPQPNVDSAIIKIAVNSKQQTVNTDLFFRIVKSGFSQPRKQILNNLSKGLKLSKEKVVFWLSENNIQPTRRAETLNVEDWVKLASTY